MLTKKKLEKLLQQVPLDDVQLLRLASAVERDNKLTEYIYGLVDWSGYTPQTLIDLHLQLEGYQSGAICYHLDLSGIPNDELIALGKKANNSSVWWKVSEALNFDGLTAHQMIKLANSAGYGCYGVWDRVEKELPAKLVGLSHTTLFRLARITRGTDIKHIVGMALSIEGMSLSEVIAFGKQRPGIWYYLIPKYLGIEPLPEEAINFGSLAHDTAAWQAVVALIRLPNAQLLEVGRAAKSESVWKLIAKRFSMARANNEVLIEVGIGANTSDVWENILEYLKLHKMTSSDLVALANRARHHSVCDFVKKRLILNGLSPVALMELGSSAEDWSVWSPILEAL